MRELVIEGAIAGVDEACVLVQPFEPRRHIYVRLRRLPVRRLWQRARINRPALYERECDAVQARVVS